jgi:hypothetical protein
VTAQVDEAHLERLKERYGPSAAPAQRFGDYKLAPIKDLHTDHNYQRPTSAWRVSHIVFNYEPALYQPLVIGARVKTADNGGRLYVIDGLHRREAGIQLWGLNADVPCMIYKTQSSAHEAKIFLWLNEKRRVLSTPQKFAARLEFKDPIAVSMSRGLKKHGFEISDYERFGFHAHQDNMIYCVGTLERIHDRSPDVYDNVLRVLREAWDGSGRACNNKIINGLSRFMYGNQYGVPTLIKRLKPISAYDLLYAGEHMAHRDHLETGVAMEHVVTNAYHGNPLRQRR